MKSKADKIFDIFITLFLVLTLIVFIYPLYFTVIASLSEPYDVIQGRVSLWVKGFTLDGYKNILEVEEIWTGYRNSLFYTIVGTFLAMCTTIPAAYAMSKKRLLYRNFWSYFFLIPMYISGGLLPTYLQVKNLGLVNSLWVQIILGLFSVYNMIIARNYFQNSISGELYEAAEIDGASHFKQFGMIALPLSKPIMAVLVLYYANGQWNNFMTTLIYVSKKEYFSLQYILRDILLGAANALNGVEVQSLSFEQYDYLMRRVYMAEAMKYSVIIIASAPMLLLFPFIQKYFEKGIMVGALKG